MDLGERRDRRGRANFSAERSAFQTVVRQRAAAS